MKNMKKLIVLLTVLLLALTLMSCDFSSLIGGGDSTPTAEETEDSYKTHKQMLALVQNYKVAGTNGFDYSLEQKYGNTVVNAHTVSVRLESDTKGSRVEYTKNLSEDVSQGMYTEKKATAYYKEDKIATYKDGAWVWQDGTLDGFSSVNLDKFSFDVNALSDITLDETNAVLTFGVADEKAPSFLGVTGEIKDLRFEIKSDASFTALTSFTLSYTQNKTTTVFRFIPYSDSVTVDFPD